MSFVYLLASKLRGTIYCGSTTDLLRRVHQNACQDSPPATGVDRLVWFEVHESLETDRARERQIEEWRRDWKIALIEEDNPYWIDL